MNKRISCNKTPRKNILQTLLDESNSIPGNLSVTTNRMRESSVDGRNPTRHKLNVKVPNTSSAPSQGPRKKPSMKRMKPTRQRKVAERMVDQPKHPEQALFKAPLKSSLKNKTTAFNCALKTSTPNDTPVKREKIKPKNLHNSEDDCESVSSSMTKVSSIQSSLIDLLKDYNSGMLDKENRNDGRLSHASDLQEIPQKLDCEADMKYMDLSETLTSTCRENTSANQLAARKVKKLRKLTVRLGDVVGSIISSGDTESLQMLAMVVVTMQRELANLQDQLPTTEALFDRETEIRKATESLIEDKSALLRKVRILNQTIKEKDCEIAKKNSAQAQSEISLELATVQCMNSSLHTQVQQLSATVQALKEEKIKLESSVRELKTENASMRQSLSNRDDDLQKKQEDFTKEATTIKKDVTDALKKVDTLKQELRDAELENELIKVSVNEKDEEIARLNDLNKGLQSSVSRLLEDLRHAPTTPLPTNEISSMILHSLDGALKPTPRRRREVQIDDELILPPFCTGSTLAIPSNNEFTRSLGRSKECDPIRAQVESVSSLFHNLSSTSRSNPTVAWSDTPTSQHVNRSSYDDLTSSRRYSRSSQGESSEDLFIKPGANVTGIVCNAALS